MPKLVTIPIDFPSPQTASDCTSSYFVEYKISTDFSYSSFTSLDPYSVVLPPLNDNTLYDIRITRTCCDGLISAPATFQVDTTTTSP